MNPVTKDMELLSNSMATYAYVKGNMESFALYFMLGVCFGLLLALTLLIMGITCRPRPPPKKSSPSPDRCRKKENEGRGEAESDEDTDEEQAEVPKVTVAPAASEHSQPNGTLRSVNVFASAEELERAQRLEERERIIREIWRNGQPDILTTGTGTLGRVHYP